MSILGIKRPVAPSVAKMTDLIDQRQHLVGRLEAINEADRRAALALGREQDQIAAEMAGAGFLKRGQLRRRVKAMEPKWRQALTDRAANQIVLDDLLKQIEAIDQQLQAVNRHYSPKKPRPTTTPAEVRR